MGMRWELEVLTVVIMVMRRSLLAVIMAPNLFPSPTLKENYSD